MISTLTVRLFEDAHSMQAITQYIREEVATSIDKVTQTAMNNKAEANPPGVRM